MGSYNHSNSQKYLLTHSHTGLTATLSSPQTEEHYHLFLMPSPKGYAFENADTDLRNVAHYLAHFLAHWCII